MDEEFTGEADEAPDDMPLALARALLAYLADAKGGTP